MLFTDSGKDEGGRRMMWRARWRSGQRGFASLSTRPLGACASARQATPGALCLLCAAHAITHTTYTPREPPLLSRPFLFDLVIAMPQLYPASAALSTTSPQCLWTLIISMAAPAAH